MASKISKFICLFVFSSFRSLWIAEEKELLQEMIGLGELRDPWHTTQVKLMERHLWLINVYSQARHNLFQYKGEILPLTHRLCLTSLRGF